MKRVSIKIPDRLDRKLTSATMRRRQRKADLVRQALEAYLDDERSPRKGSVLEQMGDLVGCASGPRDLSRHRRHVKGFGD